MTLTRTQIRAELYNRIPGLGFTGTADSVAVKSITSAYALADTTLSINHLRGMYIFRPSLSGDDTVKKALTLAPTSGQLTHSGTNYVDIAATGFEIVGPLHPDELNACIRRALQRIYFEVIVPLSGSVTDGDMDAANITSWTSSGLATLEKVTTASKVWSGFRSLHTVANSTDDYASSVVMHGFANTKFYASAVVHVDVDGAELIVYDLSNDATIASSTSLEEGFVHLYVVGTVPVDCEALELRLNSLTAVSDLYWNHVLFYPLDYLEFPAPTWLDDPWKFLGLKEARYERNLSSQGAGGYDLAASRRWHDWLQPSMFSLDPLHIDANPYQVQLQRPVPQHELWVHGKRPYSDLEDLSTESATTHAPPRLVYAYAAEEVLKVLVARYPQDARWVVLFGAAQQDVVAETQARPEIPIQPIKREVMGRI